MKSYRKQNIVHRLLAFVLCIALCIEGVPVQVCAAEIDRIDQISVQKTGHQADNIAVVDLVGSDETALGAEQAVSTDNAEEDADNQDDADNVDDSDNTTDADNSSDDSGSSTDYDIDNADTDSDSTDSANSNSVDNGSGDTADMELDNSADSISENDLNSVSGNDLESVSANTVDKTHQVDIDAAEESFARLLSEKNLMALLYHADTYDARLEPDQNSKTAATLVSGQTLYIRDVRITDEDVWYNVQFWQNGTEGTGYVQSYYLAYSDEDWIAWEEEYLHPILEAEDGKYGMSAYGMASYSMLPYAVDTSDIEAFPGSYQSALRSLKSTHPNWTFVPMKTGLDFNTSVSSEMGDKSLLQNTSSNASKGWVGEACPTESGWYYATKPAVAYYMDPRNFLTETYIFQFEQLTFNSSYHTQEAVQTFLNSTFMKGVLPDDSAKRTYAQAFFEIGKKRKLSPIHLASRVYQEQGAGDSGLISGTYPGYEGYYNFFNVGVNGSSTAEKIVKGLTYAKEKGWNTRYKSLEGGADTIGNNYILKYQDTIYLEKFNVDKNSPYGVYNHQYMQNIQAPASESSSTKKMYTNAGSLNSAFVFKIPVYDNMPDEVYYPTLSLNKTSMTLDLSNEGNCQNGQQLMLYADGIEIDASRASWRSSNPSLVTVQNGLVRLTEAEADKGDAENPRKSGEATITASYQEVEVSCKVKVVISLQEITLDKTKIALRRPDTVVQDTTGLSAEEIAENTDTAFLQITFDPADTTSDRTITWTSSNPKVAKVTKVEADPSTPEEAPRAVVTAVGKGEAVITAKASKAGSPVKTAACQVSVSAPIYQAALTNPNAKDTDTAEQTTLLAGQSVNLAAEYWPKDTTSDTGITWSSSDDKVAVVRNGTVTALSKGTAVITAKTDGCAQGYTAQHTVVVEECHITFMQYDGKTVLKKQKVLYGDVLTAQEFPEEETVPGSLFIGWYTGENGTGARFDETKPVYEKETVLYPYYEEQGKGFYVLPVGDQTYTGSVIKPAVQVYDSVSCQDGGSELIALVQGKDYTVSYKNNKKVNGAGQAIPQVVVKGKGNYKGTEYVLFNIVPKSLTDADITSDNLTAAYTGKTIKSVPVVLRSGKKLQKNTDYTVSYPQTGTGAYQTAGTYPVTITGKGGYTGTITVYETITKNVLMSKVKIAKIPNQTYQNELVDKEQGKGIEPESIMVTYQNAPLTESTDGGMTGDYTVSFSNNMAIGTATATITAVEGSGFSGSKSITYKIAGTSIARAQVEGLESKEFTGYDGDVRQTSGVYRLLLNGQELAESMDGGVTGDYVVSYANTVKAGNASILFQGVNEYTGQLKKTYKITKCKISQEEGGINPDITLRYYTQDMQDNPDRWQQITDLSQITTPYVKGGSKPVVQLTYRGIELIQGKDYTVKYANHNMVTPESAEGETEEGERQNPGRLPKITITGKGNFQGSITGYFKITDGQLAQRNESDSGVVKTKVTMTAKDVVYKNKKNAYKTTVTLTDCNGAKLAAGKDYDRNPAYTYAEDAYVYVEGTVGQIRQQSQDVGNASAGNPDGRQGTGIAGAGNQDRQWDAEYAGMGASSIENTTDVARENSDNGVILRKAGSAVEANDIPEAGTMICVTVRGTGCYAGDGQAEIEAVYRIVQSDLAKAKVKVQAKEYRNGQPVTLTEDDLVITMSGSTVPLQYGEDYRIDESTYTKNRDKGKASVVIRGLGNYGGEKKVTYTIGAKLLVWWKNLF